MTPQQKAIWTEALRSNRFKQTHNNFRDEVGHCCLGVLCVVTNELPLVNDAGNWSHVEQLLANTNVSPIKLAAMNDGGTPFPVIADWIDENMEIAPDAQTST